MAEATVRRNREYAPRMAPEQRREQLLDGVLRVIAKQGVHKVSMDSVAREIGVTRPVVYSLFDDANALLRGSLAREEQGALAQLQEVLRRAESAEPTERIAVLIDEFLSATVEAPDRWRAILMMTDASTPAFRKRLDHGWRVVTLAVESLLGSTFAAEHDLGMATRALIGYISESARLTLDAPTQFPPSRIVAFGSTLFGSLVAGV